MAEPMITPDTRQPLAHRGLRSAAELASKRPHGDRLRYLGGCRCTECRRANTEYERQRAAARRSGDWNGLVPSELARAHLAQLSARGVGRHSVAAAADVADSILFEIIHGRRKQIRARTERKILAVTEQAAADHALVDARPAWRLIRELMTDGYSQAELARQMGYKGRALQFGAKHMTARSAHDVRRLHDRLRCCPAAPTQRLLHELSEEGYHRTRVRQLLDTLASKRGEDGPDLTIRGKGRIQHHAARLVALLHAQLTGEVPHV